MENRPTGYWVEYIAEIFAGRLFFESRVQENKLTVNSSGGSQKSKISQARENLLDSPKHFIGIQASRIVLVEWF